MVVKSCVICGSDFETKSAGKVCSDECRKIQKRKTNKNYKTRNPEAVKESNKKYYQNNKKYFSEYYQNNKEHIAEYQKQWNKDNPDYKKQWRENRRNKG